MTRPSGLIDRLNTLAQEHSHCPAGAYFHAHLTPEEREAFEQAMQAKVITFPALASLLVEETGVQPSAPPKTFARQLRAHADKECRCE